MAEMIEFTLDDIAKILILASGTETGLWRIAAHFQMRAVTTAATTAGSSEGVFPAVLGALDRLALIPAEKPGPLTYDASKVFSETKSIEAEIKKRQSTKSPKKVLKKKASPKTNPT